MKKEDLSALINRAALKSVKPVKQRVVSSEKVSVMDNEKLFSLYMPVDVIKKLKIIAAEENTSIKKLINDAVKAQHNL